MRPARIALAALALLALAVAPAGAAPVAGMQVRYWSFTNHSDLRDGIVYVAPGPFHVQFEYWYRPETGYEFRPELGLHFRDARRSVYTVQGRVERDDERLWLGTEQVLGRHVVGRAEVSPILFRDSTLVAWDAGADYYWGSYNLASATLMRDPREGGLWVVPLRVRLASERNDWLQLTLAPASRRTIGWAADVKWRVVRLGVERNSRFDFTNLDNIIYTAGLEIPIPAWP